MKGECAATASIWSQDSAVTKGGAQMRDMTLAVGAVLYPGCRLCYPARGCGGRIRTNPDRAKFGGDRLRRRPVAAGRLGFRDLLAQTAEELEKQYGREAMQQALETKRHYDLYGIHFDFDRATIQPQTEPLLDDIATTMKNLPTWRTSHRRTHQLGRRSDVQRDAVARARRSYQGGAGQPGYRSREARNQRSWAKPASCKQ